jgi:hypothetical protein
MKVTLTDKTTGETLPGVVITKGTSYATAGQTDETGSVNLPATGDFIARFIGYESKPFTMPVEEIELTPVNITTGEVLILGDKPKKTALWFILLVLVLIYLSK